MLGLIGWLIIVVGTLGLALLYLLVGFIFYVFAHSAFISWLRATRCCCRRRSCPTCAPASRPAAPASGSTSRPRQEAGLPATLADGSSLGFDAEQMVLTVETPHGELVFVPENLTDAKLVWRCLPGEGLKRSTLPAACRGEPEPPR